MLQKLKLYKQPRLCVIGRETRQLVIIWEMNDNWVGLRITHQFSPKRHLNEFWLVMPNSLWDNIV